MEQTLGKRIAENRKRLGLTQDSLAEQLGITAQAVSKWENDQSCPDITMLPRLAEIFGITTDELLGRQSTPPAYEAEVVQEDSKSSNHWEFHWDGGKQHGVWFASMVLWIGVLMLVSKVLDLDAGFWSIAWPSALLFCGLYRFFKSFSISKVCLVGFGGIYLLKNLNLWEFDFPSELIFPIVVVLFGASLLIDALKKPNKPRFVINRNGVKLNGSDKSKCECVNSTNRFDCSLSFGEHTHVVDVATLEGGDINLSFGELTIDLRNCSKVSEGCNIDANCAFGELEILVPRKYRVQLHPGSAFGSVETTGYPDEMPEAIIRINASASFGAINIRYI